jgi:hypothetical protein
MAVFEASAHAVCQAPTNLIFDCVQLSLQFQSPHQASSSVPVSVSTSLPGESP